MGTNQRLSLVKLRRERAGAHLRVRVLSALSTAILATVIKAAPSTKETFFETKIRPILADHCYECHSVEAGKSKGGLRVDDREALLSGGDSGPSLVIGKPDESLLLTSMRHTDPDLVMPPEKPRLPDSVLADFSRWIADGAVDPRKKLEGGRGKIANDFESRKRHWSYLPIVEPEIPLTKRLDWPTSDIDHFILAKLEENHLSPSPDAAPDVLRRRLSFDLTGLPPTEADADRPWEESVDLLLNSAAYAPHWARHWLDVARYAESNGKEANLIYPHAWRYRDYVIDAFGNDLPYNRFLLEQIAGDLLPAKNDGERARLLTATGYLAIGPKNLASQVPEQFTAELIDEQIDSFSRGLLGVSLACARCHDHKSEPVTMADYYALVGIFKSTDTRYGTWVDTENNQGGHLIRLPNLPGQIILTPSLSKEALTEVRARLAQLDEDEKSAKKKAEEARKSGTDPQKRFNAALSETLRIYWSRGPLVGQLETVDDTGKALPLCMGVVEAAKMCDSPRYDRGDLLHPGQLIPRGVPSLYGLSTEVQAPEGESGRLQLARWIIDPENPLTARVIVNRVWSHLFGVGLVDTEDDFGRTGTAPSHPELLDFLASRFQQNGWSIRWLIREIVLSHTYRQSSLWRQDTFEADPDNRLLWRINKRRLEAEAIRDSMLSASGELDSRPARGSLVATLPIQSAGMVPLNRALPKDLDGSLYRSIYLPILRDQLPEVLQQFDFAEPSLVVGRRDTTNAAPQALYLINSDFVIARATALARRILEVAPDREARIEAAYRYCLSRKPLASEIVLAQKFIQNAKDSDLSVWQDFCQALLASADFRMID